MLKRLWLIFGPLLLASFLVFLLIFFYPNNPSHNLTEEKYSAAAISSESFKERSQKSESLYGTQYALYSFFGLK